MKIKILKIIFTKISHISYQMFLLQHIVIYKILYYFPKASTNIIYFCILFLCIITTLFFSVLLHWISIKFINTKVFNDFENWILNNKNIEIKEKFE